MSVRAFISIVLGVVVCCAVVSSAGVYREDGFDDADLRDDLHELDGAREIDEHMNVHGLATDAEQSFDYDSSSGKDGDEGGDDSSEWDTVERDEFWDKSEFRDEDDFEDENVDVHGLSAGDGEDLEREDYDVGEYGDKEDFDEDEDDIGVEGLSIEDDGDEYDMEYEDDLGDAARIEDGDFEDEDDFDFEDFDEEVDVKGLAAELEKEEGGQQSVNGDVVDQDMVERLDDGDVDIGLDDGAEDEEEWDSGAERDEEDVTVSGQAFVAQGGEEEDWEDWEPSALGEDGEDEPWGEEEDGHLEGAERYDEEATEDLGFDEEHGDAAFVEDADGSDVGISGQALVDSEQGEWDDWDSSSEDDDGDGANFEDGIDDEPFEGSVHSESDDDFIDDAAIDELIAFADEAGGDDEDSTEFNESEEEIVTGQSVVTREGEIHDPFLVEIDDSESSRRDMRIDSAGEELGLSGQAVGLAAHDLGDDFEGVTEAHGFGHEKDNVDELFENTVAAFEV